MVLASQSRIDHLYKHLAFQDVSNIEHPWNGARSILETVKYMRPRHLHASSAMLCNMQPHQTIESIMLNRGCGSE
jgi:hypothetical protein